MSERLLYTHRVCFCALAVVLGLAAAPAALGDDGVPEPPDPGLVVPAAPAAAGEPETPVVPVDPASIPLVVPPDPAPSAAPEVAPPADHTQAHTPSDGTQPTEHLPAADDGNTTHDNSGDITPSSAPSPPKTIVWNWSWNCKDDPTPADLPAELPDATTLVINWNWDCADVQPPPLSATSVTQCTGCNIAISVRIDSPGDSGDVTQTTVVEAPSLGEAMAEAAQAAAQMVVPPQTPEVSPPAPPQAPALANAADVLTPDPPPVPAPPNVLPPTPPATSVALDEAPRHRAPDVRAAPDPVQLGQRTVLRPVVERRHVSVSTVVRTVSVVHVRAVVHSRSRSGSSTRAVRRAGRAPLPGPPAPSVPTVPLAIAPAAGETHGGGAVSLLALAVGAIGALLLLFLAYAAPGLQTVRPRPAQAQPDPPG